MAENGYFGQIAPQKGPYDPLVGKPNIQKIGPRAQGGLNLMW